MNSVCLKANDRHGYEAWLNVWWRKLKSEAYRRGSERISLSGGIVCVSWGANDISSLTIVSGAEVMPATTWPACHTLPVVSACGRCWAGRLVGGGAVGGVEFLLPAIATQAGDLL